MKIAVISDLHGNLPEYDLSGIEMLLICGDISPLSLQRYTEDMRDWIDTEFRNWILDLEVPQTVFIGGNHDFICESEDAWMHSMFPSDSEIVYLKNEAYEYSSDQDSEVYKIFGSPYCKLFGRWPFMKSPEELSLLYSQFPADIDILITHDAPMIGKLGCITSGPWAGKDAGNPELAEAIKIKKPRYSFCGHIHSGQHELFDYNGTLLANTSIVDEAYEVTNEPLIIDITKE